MIQPGTISQGRELAEQRWNAMFPFSLDPSTWAQLLIDYRPAEVLQGIKMMRSTHDTRPERAEQIYAHFLRVLDTIATSRR
jgi:hypothetical protein